ncbi:MAG: hypothetical protein M3Q75_11670 [Gemmatimonadota bacterium]|nr:hypothetical protein [Gemmatimonadota bacterium]
MTAPGGYQRPANPAPVSGPGAMSRRTDGGPAQPVRELPDAQYGEGKAFRESQQAAPLAAQAQPAAASPQPAAPSIVGLDEPSSRPGEPVTAGAPLGPGPNSVTGRNGTSQTGRISATLSRLAASDPSGGIVQLMLKAQERGL